MPSAKAKGKARADPPSERTPLLPSTSSSSSGPVYDQAPPPRRRRWGVYASLVAFFAGAGFIALLAASFVPSEREIQDLPESFKYDSPTLNILNIGDDGVHVSVTLMGGLDTYSALAVDGRRGQGWWQSVRRGAAHVLPLPDSVRVTIPQLQVYPRGGGLPLLNVSLPGEILVPLVRGDELRPLAVEALGAPIASVGEIWTWAQKAWAAGDAEVVLGVPEAQARLLGISFSQTDLAFPLKFDVPALPNFPKPGKKLNLSKLVTLHNYTFNNADGLRIAALAALPNPGLGEIPFPLPFAIEFEGTRMAEVVARTATISSEKIELALEGDIVAASAAGSSDALGDFLRRFLHGQDSPIVVRGLHDMPRRYRGPSPPQFVLQTLPSLTLDLTFPAPHPAPDIVRSVTVEGMKFGGGEVIEASGTVVALVQLPPGLESVDLDVSSIQPDVFIFDGSSNGHDDRPDPHNPPEGAFARIHPAHYLNATTARSDDPATPDALVVRAPFENVPLDILEGREGLFRGFVSKVIFKGGANAGIGGVVDVRADLGVGDDIEIGDLPVTGDFWVGRSARMATLHNVVW
ncbi:hypothetical protein CcaverHIS002_0304820 [Cutaneotrichosporon cavernicola]|uniref:Pre-rRNA processing protein n=1 Tax=Cutaneotrichosporon cavernicola TaxID=279322 RepID=A0AA48ICM0_9TREE|nr:uncharacterized protein CcaverHIS019_0304770 [Cutaneotrichosporon cavernicola]BEI82614.1 hypothetical protein CcaverHIS002_0304820 [Cutaneotrichosporon cavernicola]BEI90407.1 hypothetical protein CcaverHIS019_0304770 [Cutaneotrichosporon cavernicola]BEI98183.1 hypothetical protein CcaverHIS631_0304820 [Cutaneotrichosporon cavernicola]BEJ05959.1 hypothetical protein CcaverHIS641_0304810 [Cutaneotrichosporon cavernicola]